MTHPIEMRKKTRSRGGCGLNSFLERGRLLLPRALLMAVSLQALFALMLIHLQTAFLFEVTHVVSGLD